MAEHRAFAPGMQVLTSDGELLGTVERPASDGFMLRRMGASDPTQETIPDMWVHRVDEKVHLNRTGAEALAGWRSLRFKTSDGVRPGAPTDAQADTRRGTFMLWAILMVVAAVAAIAAYLLLAQP